MLSIVKIVDDFLSGWDMRVIMTLHFDFHRFMMECHKSNIWVTIQLNSIDYTISPYWRMYIESLPPYSKSWLLSYFEPSVRDSFINKAAANEVRFIIYSLFVLFILLLCFITFLYICIYRIKLLGLNHLLVPHRNWNAKSLCSFQT